MMVQPMPQYAVALLVAAALAVFIIAIAWPRRAAPGAKPLIAFQLCIILWTVPYAVHWLIASANARFFWLDATYPGVVFAAVAFLAFALDYTGRGHWLTRRTLIALCLVPIVTLAALFTDSTYELFYGGHRTSGLIFSGGPVFWLNVIYGYSLMLFALAVLIRDFRRAPRLQRQQAGIILTGALAPFIINLISLAGLSPVKDLDLTPFAFTLTGLLYAVGLFQFNLFDLVPIARGVLIEQLSDGMLVLDQQQRVVDLNPAAQHLLDRTEARLIGQTLPQVLDHWPTTPVWSPAPIELALPTGRIAEARLSPLMDRRGQQRGAVIVLRDITDRKQVDAALRESEARYRHAQQIGHVGNWEFNLKTNAFWGSDEAQRLYGFDPRQADFSTEEVEACIPERERVHQALIDLIETGTPYDLEFEIRPRNSTHSRIIASRAELYRDESGQPHRVVGVIQDISERKQAEEALRENVARATALLNAIPDSIFRMDRQGIFLDYKAEDQDLYTNRQNIVGAQIRAITPPEFADLVMRQVHATLETGVLQAFEYQLPVPDRGIRDYEARMVASGSNEVTAIVRDITERKQIEEALHASEQRFRTLFEQAAVGVALLETRTGRYVDINQRYCDFLGYTREEMLDPNLQAVTHPDDVQINLDNNALLMAGEIREFSIEKRYIRKDGTVVWGNLTVSPLWVAGEQPATYLHIAVVQDITERKHAEDALRDLNAALEQRVADRTAELQIANRRLTVLDHLKDEFLARISHELRTPLAGILISLELLETAKPEKRDRYMQRLKQATDRLREMIEDVLMFSQLNLYTQPSTLEPIDLNNLIEGRSMTWQNLRAGRELQFQLDLARDLPRARADGELFMQALSRLIINAINYTPAGSVIVSTACVDEDNRQWATVSVKDTGPGITPEDLPNIFERFYRGCAAADYKTPGTGVGLSISREIAQKLGGRLTVETEVGVGSTFTLWLPLWSETAEGEIATEAPSP